MRENFYELQPNDIARVNWLVKRSDDLADRVKSYRGTSHLVLGVVVAANVLMLHLGYRFTGMVIVGGVASIASWICLHWPRKGISLVLMPDETQWPSRSGFEQMMAKAETETMPEMQQRIAKLAVYVKVGVVGLMFVFIGMVESIIIKQIGVT